MLSTRSTALAAVAAPALLLSLAGTAAAEGGGGSEIPPPPPSATPCAALTALILDDTVTVRTAAKATLRYSVKSCSSATQSVVLSFTRTWTYGTDATPCDAPGWTGPTVTLRPGDKVAVDVTVPVPDCPFGSNGANSYVYATATAPSTGATLSTARAHVTYKPGV